MTEDMLRTAVLYSAEAPNEDQMVRFKTFIRERYGKDVDFRWEKTEDGVKYTITIPANCTAEIRLPGGRLEAAEAGVHEYLA